MIRRYGFIPGAMIILALFAILAVAADAAFVSVQQADLAKLLPPPPAEASAQTQAEILELLDLQKTRTPQQKSAAASDNRYSVFQFASGILGPKFDWDNLPLTEKFFKSLGKDAITVFSGPKDIWNRKRPFLVNMELKPCADPSASASYPSGHSTFGYLAAIVLADMIPEKRAELFDRAAQYAGNRMVCGVHYRSDIEAGRIAGTVIAALAMQNPQFQKEFTEVRKEVRKVLGLP